MRKLRPVDFREAPGPGREGQRGASERRQGSPHVGIRSKAVFGAAAAVLVLLSLPRDGLALKENLRFQRLSVKDGLSQNTVKCIIQDSRGFIWFGTSDGLNRYDGSTFHKYRHDPDNPFSLSHNVVASLAVDQSGTLWVGTNGGGLNKFDRTTERMSRFQNDPSDPRSLSDDRVTAICPSRKSPSILWLGTESGGLNRFDIGSGQSTRYRHDPNDPNSLGAGFVRAVWEDISGIVWIGTDGGLNRLDSGTGQMRRYAHDLKGAGSLSNNYVNVLLEDRAGNIWIGTDGGLNLLTPSAARFEAYRNIAGDPSSLSSNLVRALVEDAAGTIWVGTFDGGLNRFDRQTKTFDRFQNEPHNSDSLSYNSVASLYADRTGILWIGTYTQGINKYDRQRNQFALFRNDPSDPDSLNSNIVKALYEDRAGVLWVGTNFGGLNRLDRNTGKFIHFLNDPSDPGSLSNNWVTSILEDTAGTLWVGTVTELNKRDPRARRFRRSFPAPTGLEPFTGNYNGMMTILEDRTETLWVGAPRGLCQLDRTTGLFTCYQHDPRNPNTMSSDLIMCLYEDSAGRLWVGTQKGLNLMDRRQGTFRRYLHDPKKPDGLSSDDICSLYESPSTPGILWICTFGGGLNKLKVATGEVKCYREKDGLPNDVVYTILEDAGGNFWMSTNSGISRFNPVKETFKNYDTRDGVQGNEFNRAWCKSRTGEMFFGGMDGFNAFYPEEIKDDSYVPPVFITDLKIFNKSVPIGRGADGRDILTKSILETKSIALSYRDSVFSLEFAALNFSIPEKSLYTYTLEGADSDWIYTDAGRRSATYTKLGGGTYLFKVRASNNDGVWNEQGASLKIVIKPPVWKTWWAYALYLLGSAALIIGVGRYRMNVHRIRQERRLKRETARSRLQEMELRAQAMEAEARALKSENERKEIELQKSHELQKAYQDLKDTQQQLIQAERLASLGQLTAGIAHEIKNPLNFVNNFAELSLSLVDELHQEMEKAKPRLEPETVRASEEILSTLEQNMAKITEHGKRADSIVRGMLLHSRGKPGERQSTDLNALLAEYTALAYHGMRARSQSFNVKIETEFDPNVGMIDVVPQDISRAFLNIVNNACYAANEKAKTAAGFTARVKVRTKNQGDAVEIRVWDNGPGIPESVLDKIYNPFFTTKPPGSGTGLGLYLSFDIITVVHKGKIRVETKEGEFTEFIIVLPREIPKTEAGR
jgi:ligand-binding sensor domain-containing protein/signal transduction histidine kinase